jgi:hypothetical protein
LPGPADAQVPHFGQTQVVLLPVPREGGAGELGCLDPVLRLEAGKRRPLLEEAAEGGLQVPEGLLKGNTGNLIEPAAVRLLSPRGQGRAQLAVAGRGLILGITVDSVLKRPIVNEANTPKGLSQKAPLPGARVASECVPHLHATRGRL